MDALVAVRREPGRTEVVIRAYRDWSKVAGPMALALVVWLLFTALVLLPRSRASAFAIALTCGVGLFLAYVLVIAVAWLLIGREIVTATPETLRIEHRILRRVNGRSYSTTGVVNLRAVSGGPVMHRGRVVEGAPALSFEYGGRVVRFGAGLAGATGEQVAADLRYRMAPSRSVVHA